MPGTMRLRRITATYPYTEVLSADFEAALDEILALHARAWQTLAAIAGGRDQIRWQTAGLEVGGLRVRVLTLAAAKRLARAGYLDRPAGRRTAARAPRPAASPPRD